MYDTDSRQILIETFKDLFNFSRDVLWTIEPDGTISYVSPAITILRGIDQETARSQPIEEIHPPDSAAKSTAYFLYMLEEIQSGRKPKPFKDTMDYYHADGSTLTTEVYAVPIFDPNGNFIFLAGVSRDISSRLLQEAKKQAKQQARDAEFKSMLNMVLEHEVRNALSLIQNALNENTTPLKVKMARSAADNIVEVLKQINLFTTSAPEESRLQSRPVPIAATIQEIATALNSQQRIKINDPLSQQAWGDRSITNMCLMQLLSNAIKYGNPSSLITVNIEAEQRNYIDGIGINIINDYCSPAPIDPAKLFEPFYREPHISDISGSGLGLPIALRLAKLQHGDISIKKLGQNITVTLWLPTSDQV